MRRLLIALAVVAAALLVADRAGAALAERAVAQQVQASGEVQGTPAVSIHGFPFLTQALRGDYSSIEVSGTGVSADQGLSAFDARLSGVHLPVSAALSGTVSSVPVDRVVATGLLTYAELERRLGDRRLSLSSGGDLLRVTGRVTVLGRTVSASALSSLRVRGSTVVVTAERFEVGSKPADRALSAALGSRLDFTVNVGRLPYGLVLRSVTVEPTGVRATATATGTRLTRLTR